MKQHALRLNHPIRCAMQELYVAGRPGMAAELTTSSATLEAWGLAEFFTDPSRILQSRVRLTASGERIVETLINPQ